MPVIRPRRPDLVFAPSGTPKLRLEGTDGARDIETDDYLHARRAIRDALACTGIVAVIGESGLGKTNAAYRAVQELGHQPAYLELEPERLGKNMEQDMLERCVTGYDARNTRSDMRRDLRKVGLENRFVFMVDEVERSKGYGIELIRYLWTQHGNQVTFVLVGAGLDPFLDANPALKSRVTRYARFYPWTAADALRYAPQYHPLFERATPAVLRAAYERIGGSFREWARLLETSLKVISETGAQARLTKDVLDEARERRG